MGRPWRGVVPVAAWLAVCLLAAGCGSSEPDPQGVAGSTAAGFPVTVTNCGRTLTFESPPRRVVTGYQPVLETMLALGLADRIVGRVNFSENGPDGFLPGQKPLYERIPEISDSIAFPNREVLLAQDADFVISEGWYNFNASRGEATIDELTGAGTPVFLTGGWCDDAGQRRFQIADTLRDVRDLGRIFGVPERAEEVVAEMEAILAEVRTAVAGRPKVPVLVTDGGAGPVRAYGGAGLTQQLVEAAGGVNVLADASDDLFDASVEQVAATRPAAMIVTDYLPGPTAAEKFATVSALVPESAAARSKRYLALPAAGQHPGYRNILTLRQIARFLHPDAVS
ncbi:ABC transporter substrate-binding protein [Plantactinospora sp. WMMB334]|uniref:ABC transporter substrate-binding protein n=1 Tax=Plantactinospora sp. WMMB334 TaxID=3404119 RepID=UPI003B9603A1